MARPSNRDERRAQIVDGLLRVLPETGYERATIQRIAEAAGLGAGLVHHHFGSKLEILLALGERLAELVSGRQREARTPRARVDAWIDAHLAQGDDASAEAVACWVALGAEALVHPEVRALHRTLLERRRADLDARLREVCRDEARSTRGLDVLVANVLATVEGYFQIATTVPDVIPRGSAAGATRAMTHRLLDAMPARESASEPDTNLSTTLEDSVASTKSASTSTKKTSRPGRRDQPPTSSKTGPSTRSASTTRASTTRTSSDREPKPETPRRSRGRKGTS
jgi:TetR/AcrR family transcriptional repressor of bet genes